MTSSIRDILQLLKQMEIYKKRFFTQAVDYSKFTATFSKQHTMKESRKMCQ